MANALLEKREAEFAATQAELATLHQRAVDSPNEKLSENDQSSLDELTKRANQLADYITEKRAEESRLAAAGKAMLDAQQAPADLERTVSEKALADVWGTPGAYIVDVMRAAEDPEAADRISKRDKIIKRALANEITTDVPGIVPTPIVGDVVKLLDGSRPVFDALPSMPMPAKGATFTRPVLTQNAAVGVQATQKTEVSSQKLTIDPLTVTKVSLGGALDVSFQAIDWTDPAILDIALSNMADVYAVQSDTYVASMLNTAATANASPVLAPAATAAATLSAFYAAAAKVYGDVRSLPDLVVLSPDQWAALSALTDTTGRPLFPTLAPSNAAGTAMANSFTLSICGIRAVVDPNLPDETILVGASKFAETYEASGSPFTIRAVEVALLGWNVGLYGYVASVVTQSKAFTQIPRS